MRADCATLSCGRAARPKRPFFYRPGEDQLGMRLARDHPFQPLIQFSKQSKSNNQRGLSLITKRSVGDTAHGSGRVSESIFGIYISINGPPSLSPLFFSLLSFIHSFIFILPSPQTTCSHTTQHSATDLFFILPLLHSSIQCITTPTPTLCLIWT